jgi:hypothetical protein
MLYRDAPKEWGANLMEVVRLQNDLDRAITPGRPSGKTPALSLWSRALEVGTCAVAC